MSHRYLGSKVRLVDWIGSILGRPGRTGARFVDLFAGTGVVSRRAARAGWEILANDHLLSAAVMTRAQLASEQTATFDELGGYCRAIALLNAAHPKEGFVWREYSPSGRSSSGHIRYYFTTDNASRIDGIRTQIADWAAQREITVEEEHLLLADLMRGANTVANIAGTYGCFLQPWQPSAVRSISLSNRPLLKRTTVASVQCKDAGDVTCRESDVVYLDPPYTKRQHAAYYHVLETIAHGDEPLVSGVTGLRPWTDKASDFCYRKRARGALDRTIQQLASSRILLSYSSDGHLSLRDVQDVLSRHGRITAHPAQEVARYRPNKTAMANHAWVNEYVFELTR